MNKNRELKHRAVEGMRDIFETSGIVIVMRNNGLTVPAAKELRRRARRAKSQYFVAKNTLVKIALEGTKFQELGGLMSGPVSLACSDDPVAISKVVHEFVKEGGKLEIRGACMDGKAIDLGAIETLASLPSLDELRSRLLGLMNAPATKLVRIFNEPAAKLARALGAYSRK